ncbi:MAG: M23 family metallopeptidase [Flavobacteriales bacterium]|jgi:murein DD-endopeptidase MepM/ murein hydrolase activator NlpD|nr:M23 family metallopeptidase [Flavobacteriales bacterium]
MIKKIIFLFLLLSQFAWSQTNWEKKLSKYHFVPPVNFPMKLSGNFCELRSNHFHGGLDIKTGGVEGKKVVSIADGYISRIKISPYGYGKALYIHHPESGITSVYAHLQKFNPQIDRFIKSYQKRNKKNEVDLTVKEGKLPIKQGGKIGLSGNSGGSGGPHLHFEVRNMANQHPINPQYVFKKVSDKIPPDISSLMVYDFASDAEGLINRREKFTFKETGSGKYMISDTLKTTGFPAFGIKIYDRANGAKNKNGFYSLDYYVDNQKAFSVLMDEYSYAESRYINALVDYDFLKKAKERFLRLFPMPNMKLSVIDYDKQILFKEIEDNLVHQAKVIVKDIKGNISVAQWKFKKSREEKNSSLKEGLNLSYKEASIVDEKGIEMAFSSKSLYHDIAFTLDTQWVKGIPKVDIEPENYGIHKKIKIEMDCPEKLLSRIHKLCFVFNGSYQKARFEGKRIFIKTRNLKDFTLDYDNDRPYIKILNFKKGQNLTKKKKIIIKGLDLQSGIKKYEAKLNGKWVIVDYDAKRNRFYHYFENKPNGKKHQFSFQITDNCGNSKIIKTEFIR